MAIARCEECGLQSHVRYHYVSRRLPVCHPQSGVVCGRSVCDRPAFIWLTATEELDYQCGQRVFFMKTNTVKVRLQ